MTDAELDALTERCMNGDPDAEAEYNRLTRRATRKVKALLANPKRLAEVIDNAFVPPPTRN